MFRAKQLTTHYQRTISGQKFGQLNTNLFTRALSLSEAKIKIGQAQPL
jgi:hypothetical protein